MKRVLTLLLTLALIQSAVAQAPQLNLPDDPELRSKASEKFALSVDAMSVDNYREAANSLGWLLKNVPELYDGLYINSYKAYEELAEKSTDESKKNMYLDSMIISYNLKEDIYELTDREKNNRAYRYYKYWKANKEKMSEAIEAYESAYENHDDVINNNIVSYMDIIRRAKAYGEPLSNDDVFNVYTEILSVIDLKESQGEDAEKMEKYRETVNSLLTMTMGDDLDCEFINNNIAPGLDKGDDPKLAKKVFGLLLNQQCSDSPYFIKAAEMIQKSEPTEGVAKVIAQRAFSNKEYDKAIEYYRQAIELSTDLEKKAGLLIDLTSVHISKGAKAEAREVALEAAEIHKPSESQALTLIANMYMNSFDECSKKQSQIDDRAIFMAAYDLYQKAGNTELMKEAKAQFPTVSDVFTANKKEGETIRVGCWINVTTTIRARPSN